ncbi:hypothetical protein BD311DRAFT_263409 [Dichomitus squalens]|uniref:Secreted protein n=1 Tax=Dichomitus squalens TaxID=114155 RepID=A0A4V6MVZ0_9APHY|nr:hypothetical protein BD311DRAFT_263409 [Dichomitus squalens]
MILWIFCVLLPFNPGSYASLQSVGGVVPTPSAHAVARRTMRIRNREVERLLMIMTSIWKGGLLLRCVAGSAHGIAALCLHVDHHMNSSGNIYLQQESPIIV